MHSASNRQSGRSAFTLIEIMLVVAVIGLLASIAVPSFIKARVKTQNTRFIKDIQTAADAFVLYSFENRRYPPDVTPAVMPLGMAPYLANMDWTGTTTVGGEWDWDLGQFGYKAGVSVYFGNVNMDARMQEIDEEFDDGILVSGQFRKRNQGYIYIIEF